MINKIAPMERFCLKDDRTKEKKNDNRESDQDTELLGLKQSWHVVASGADF
jgi:hypothetical protein